MPLEEKLVRKGYLPENLPPAFFAADIADYIADNSRSSWWSHSKKTVRPATYNASKRGTTRRVFSLVHPITMRDSAKFVAARWEAIQEYLTRGSFSLSVPEEADDQDRAIQINSHSSVEAAKVARLSEYRFIAKTDISRFYHSIYTHSLPWAFHGKLKAKNDRSERSNEIFFNRADHILRCGQDGQTVGIPVGPDTSRIFAEVVASAIDLEFQARCDIKDFAVIRYVDDVWIGAHSHADVERALWRYREAMREFELDINESKTKIYSSDFRFADVWPSELSIALEIALNSSSHQRPERVRSALEHAFTIARESGDDAILKYVIRYLDRHNVGWENWDVVEPFLKRCVVHFGHTIDYVARVIVWRHLAKRDLDRDSWSRILSSLIDTHGRIGNDSEVCWATYASARLGIALSSESVQGIVSNCGALSLVSVLNCAAAGFADHSVFRLAFERIRLESANGAYWPVIMEWRSRKWPQFAGLKIDNDVIGALVKEEAVLFDLERLPLVFSDIDESEFDEVPRAIEDRPTMYDDDGDDADDDYDDADDDYDPSGDVLANLW